MKARTGNSQAVLVFLATLISIGTVVAQAQEPASKLPHKPASQTSTSSQTSASSAAGTSTSSAPRAVGGSGTPNFIPLWTGKQVIGNSILSQNASGLNVGGGVTAASFFGDGSQLINVNALTLQGLSSSSFAQVRSSNTFTGDQTINGNLNLTGYINSALMLQGNLSDGTGQEGANVLGGFAGDPNTGASGNSIAPGVIGATIAGGGGSYDSSILPQRPQAPSNGNLPSNPRSPRRPPGTAQTNPSAQPPASTQAQSSAAAPSTGIVPGPNLVQQASNWATIGGGLKNTAAAFASTVGGGFANTSSGNYSTIAGGYGNTASGGAGTVGGGSGNVASGGDAIVAGGVSNTAAGYRSFIGGGDRNQVITSTDSFDEGDVIGGGGLNVTGDPDLGFNTVAGGYQNQATGGFSTVPGGNNNVAKGAGSFAAGSQATANFFGSFVWSASGPTSDSAPYQFVAAAQGGFFFYTSSDGTTGATLPAGSGSWNSLSDRNVKDNFAEIDSTTLLTKLAALPIRTWNYKAQPTSVRHMGPTAQDFRAAFNLGEDEKHISTIDSEGVALAGIQALYKLVQEKDAKISELTQALQEKSGELQELARRLSRLEQIAESGAAQVATVATIRP